MQTAPDIPEALVAMLSSGNRIFIEQHWRAWYEILLNWEQRNEYAISSTDNRLLGYAVEQGGGFLRALARVTLGSHRPFDIAVIDAGTHDLFLEFTRRFFFLFSEMAVRSPAGRELGRVRQRFGFAYRMYELLDADGQFAKIFGPRWRPWTFRVVDGDGTEVAKITKKWSGLGREYFTDADNFLVDFGDSVDWTIEQRAIILAAALSIDFDFFENNQSR